MPTLHGMRQSPWTEKARWALDHHGLSYDYEEHVPLVGELLLRRKSGEKKPSVPMLTFDGEAISSSIAIARHADRIGRGSPLFPRGKEDEIDRWNEVSDVILCAGRARVFTHLTESREAQREALPGFVPSPLRGVFGPSTKLAVRFLAKKYGVTPEAGRASADTIRASLARVREALGGRPYLLSELSFADIAAAVALSAVRPPDRLAIGPATRRAWTDESLASEFGDLLMWRDALYAKHR
jgi:glutathione S-transferase